MASGASGGVLAEDTSISLPEVNPGPLAGDRSRWPGQLRTVGDPNDVAGVFRLGTASTVLP